MTDIYALTDNAILAQIGQELKKTRVRQNLSQQALASASGLSAFSISQMENGHNTSLMSLVMVLRALNRLDVFEELFKEKPISPIALSEYAKKHPQRKRAYKSAKASTTDDFNWDND